MVANSPVGLFLGTFCISAYVSSAPAYMPSRDAKCHPVFSYAREYICGVGNKLIIQQTVDNFCYVLQLQQALTYLDKWFNFSESSVASVMSQIAFRKIPTFQNMMTVSTLLGLDMHQTKPRQPVWWVGRNEISVWVHYIAQHSQRVCHSKMAAIVCRDSAVTSVGLPVNVFRIVSAALSIPGSIAFCERVFSLMNAIKVEGREK